MLKIFELLKTQNLKKSLSDVGYRFPISVLIILITSGLFFSLVHQNFTNSTEEYIIRSIFSLVITFFLVTWVYITVEWNSISKTKSYILQVLSVLFWILFFYGFDQNIDNFENFVFFILTLIWIISFLFFAPYIKKIISGKEKQNVFFSYFYKTSSVFLTSFILWILLFTLWNIAIMAVFELFDIDWAHNSEIIWDWATISLSLITPIFALTQLPIKSSFNKNQFKENSFFSFLTKYIATPFIYIYFIILYAYSIKVLSNFWDWPKWEVSWLVIWFSIFGYLTYIFSLPFDLKNKFITSFRKIFPFVVIPQIFMLFYAIYLRINQYDITINRYFVVVFWIWLLTISLYYIFSKKKSLSTTLSTLTLFTIIISIWPWSVYNLPEKRQLSILKDNLQQAWILKNWEIIPLKNYSDIDKQLSWNIYSGIDYLCNFSKCENIKTTFQKQYSKLLEKDKKEFDKRKKEDLETFKNNEKQLKNVHKRVYKWPSKWEIINYITDNIKVEAYYKTSKARFSTINIFLENYNDLFPIDTKWYSKIYKISDYMKEWESEYVQIDIENKKIKINRNNQTIESIDISHVIDSIYNTYKQKATTKFSKSELTFELWKYKLILENINIVNPEFSWEDMYKNYYTNWYLLER